MTQYLVAIHHPDNYDPSLEDEAMHRDIDSLNAEMAAAGVRVFAGGLQHAAPGEIAASAAQWRSDRHGRAVSGSQGARGWFLAAGSR